LIIPAGLLDSGRTTSQVGEVLPLANAPGTRDARWKTPQKWQDRLGGRCMIIASNSRNPREGMSYVHLQRVLYIAKISIFSLLESTCLTPHMCLG
jgi:hypothetical protein